MSYLNSFSAYLATDAGKKAVDPELLERLVRSGDRIETLTQLLRFGRERWPDEFPADFRKDAGTSRGRTALRLVWQQYLGWKENGAPERKAGPGPKAVAG